PLPKTQLLPLPRTPQGRGGQGYKEPVLARTSLFLDLTARHCKMATTNQQLENPTFLQVGDAVYTVYGNGYVERMQPSPSITTTPNPSPTRAPTLAATPSPQSSTATLVQQQQQQLGQLLQLLQLVQREDEEDEEDDTCNASCCKCTIL